MKISRRSFMSGLHATFLTTALASITPSAYAMESPGMDSLDVLVSMHYFLSAPDNGTILWPKEYILHNHERVKKSCIVLVAGKVYDIDFMGDFWERFFPVAPLSFGV